MRAERTDAGYVSARLLEKVFRLNTDTRRHAAQEPPRLYKVRRQLAAEQ